MPIDTSMYQNMLRPPKSVAEYDADAMQGQTNKLALMTGQQKADEYQRSVADSNRLRGVVSGFGSDQTANYNALLGAGRLDEAQKYQKGNADLGKINADAAETKSKTKKTDLETASHQFEIAGQLASAWATRPDVTKAQVQAGLAAALHSGVISPEIAQAKMAELTAVPEDPKAINVWANGTLQQVMKAKDSMSYIAPDANAKLTAQTSTDNNAASNETSRANNAATVGATIGGQKLTAGTAAARLAFDKEQAVGSGPDASEAMIDAIGQGKMAPPTGYALRNPKILQMMERVAQKYPEYDATEYAGKTRAMRDFTTGKQGDSIRSFAVASDHLTQLGGLVDALENKDIPLVNKYGNIIAQQTGSVAPTNFDAAKGIVAKEVLKSIVAGGGGVEERQELAHLLDNAKTGPQLKGVINTYLHLMEAQREGLTRQYEISTGRKDAKTRFDYSKKPGDAPRVDLPKAAPATNSKGWVLHTDADGNRAYVSPDGKQFQEVP